MAILPAACLDMAFSSGSQVAQPSRPAPAGTRCKAIERQEHPRRRVILPHRHDDLGYHREILASRPAAASPSTTAGMVFSCRNRFDPNGITSRPSPLRLWPGSSADPARRGRLAVGRTGRPRIERRRHQSVPGVLTAKSSRSPSFQAAKIARSAPTISLMRATGWSNSAP